MPTPQTQALDVANNLIGLSAQLIGVYNACKAVQTQWTDDNVANMLALQATAVLNADGSVGVADGAPNVAHPMTHPLLLRSLSQTQITQLKGIIDSFVAFVEGQAIGVNANTRAFLQFAVG